VKVLKVVEPFVTRKFEGPFSIMLLEISTKSETHDQPKAANMRVRLQCLYKMYFVLVNYRLNNSVIYQISEHLSKGNKNRVSRISLLNWQYTGR
jgi:hypothetical protein